MSAAGRRSLNAFAETPPESVVSHLGVTCGAPARIIARREVQMMGVFAEFERATIRERVKSGLERAKARGKALGRPPIDAEKEAAISADLGRGKAGIVKLAAAHAVGVGTVQRIEAALAG